MTKEWPQPGDVGMVECSDGEWRRAICGTRMLDDSPVWVFRDGARRDARTSEARPLVVIDPEDEDSVTRLADALIDGHSDRRYGVLQDWLSVQAALREFAKPSPPKPEEPKGHLASVEDVDGERWINWRDPRSSAPHFKPWVSATDAGTFRDYKDIDVAEVLFEGVA